MVKGRLKNNDKVKTTANEVCIVESNHSDNYEAFKNTSSEIEVKTNEMDAVDVGKSTALLNGDEVTQNSSLKIEAKEKIFQKFTVRDVVFLAITAAVMIVTCAVMPLVKELTRVLFGIAQVVTGFQMSFFIAIGLMKVRKPFSLTLMLLFMGVIMIAMSPVMGVSNVFVALVAELIIILIFRGYKKDIACFIGAAIVPPLGLIVPNIWNSITSPEVFAVAIKNPWVVFGMTSAVFIVGILGALLGVKVAKELDKAGVLKKNKNKDS